MKISASSAIIVENANPPLHKSQTGGHVESAERLLVIARDREHSILVKNAEPSR